MSVGIVSVDNLMYTKYPLHIQSHKSVINNDFSTNFDAIDSIENGAKHLLLCRFSSRFVIYEMRVRKMMSMIHFNEEQINAHVSLLSAE